MKESRTYHAMVVVAQMCAHAYRRARRKNSFASSSAIPASLSGLGSSSTVGDQTLFDVVSLNERLRREEQRQRHQQMPVHTMSKL